MEIIANADLFHFGIQEALRMIHSVCVDGRDLHYSERCPDSLATDILAKNFGWGGGGGQFGQTCIIISRQVGRENNMNIMK